MTSDAHINDLLKKGVSPVDAALADVGVDKSQLAFNADPEALTKLAVIAAQKGMESGVNTQGIAINAHSSVGKTKDEGNGRHLDDLIYMQTLELVRQMAALDSRLLDLSQDMNEIAGNYLSSEDMARKVSESDEQYYQRQYQLMKARHEQGYVSDSDYATYETSYNEWCRTNEQKQEIQKELDKPEHQQALREMGEHQQNLQTRHLELTKRISSITQLFDGLKAIKSMPEGADTAKDIAFMRLLQSQPEMAMQLNSLPNAANMTTDEKISGLEQIAEQTQIRSTAEENDILQDKNRLSVITSAEVGSSYAQQTGIEVDDAVKQVAVASPAGHFAGLKL